MSIPTKAATAAFQFVEADIALSNAKRALRTAKRCTDDGSGEPGDDNRKCWQRGEAVDEMCDACQARAPLALAVKDAAQYRKFLRLRAIRAVKGVL